LVKTLFDQQGIPTEVPATEGPIPLPGSLPIILPGVDNIGIPIVGGTPDDFVPPPFTHFEKILELVKDRCTLLPDFVPNAGFFFQRPPSIDLAAVQPKWTRPNNYFLWN